MRAGLVLDWTVAVPPGVGPRAYLQSHGLTTGHRDQGIGGAARTGRTACRLYLLLIFGYLGSQLGG